ncbi:MAG: methyltransferase domain-containing protein [Anaerolineales bacterium]|nr:MAG: methyltransferase domain-containing protein [Anaerolineales bacterium]
MTAQRGEGAYREYVLRYYNRFSNLYDLGEFMRHRTRRKAFELSGWQPGESVLDLCTGTGGLALAFASRGANVVGVDLARGMLKRASTKKYASNVNWLEMDATRLAFPKATFDVSVLSLALHHMPEAAQINVLSELRRVTRRRIVLIEPEVPVKPSWFRAWAFVASVIDESEYMHEWVRQDLVGTCEKAGLRVEGVETSRFWIHRFLLCNPT